MNHDHDIQVYQLDNKWYAIRISDGCYLAVERTEQLAWDCARTRYEHL